MSFSASAADERVLDVQSTDDTLSVSLRDGRVIAVPLVWFPRLLHASAEQRAQVELTPRGLHWAALDEDISVAGLLAGMGDVTRSVASPA